ncbi:glycosyltransferase family 9 protein [Acidiferrobacter sp.]|uniref:glycosyltransferase family 9 protein n=1 Tax=Acidiferrobacter sp. TaxID=1872107 RepID=UPI00260D2BE9|nr:glycosyltransferase family 9 protein [Acidiferrobacter sp.]
MIDVLVNRGTEGVLAGNADIRRVLVLPERPSWRDYARWLRDVARRYDLAIPVIPGDRPFAYALITARSRVGAVPALGQTGHWKRRFYDCVAVNDMQAPMVIQYLRLADCLGVERCYEVVPPVASDADTYLAGLVPFEWGKTRFAVLHLAPLRRYKRWTHEGWRLVVDRLVERDVPVLVSGGPAPEEKDYVREALGDRYGAVTDLTGRLSFPALATLLRHATVYVGPDTAVTHLAAATGAPTLALYGPTDPVRWGPCPARFMANRSPYAKTGGLQRAGNVVLFQGPGSCVPCQEEGCERHRDSFSRCLDELPSESVIAVLDEILSRQPPKMV